MLIKVPVSWLREYVDITVPIDDLALKLHMSSTEVKGIERPWWDDKIRTARVEKLAKHPNADKLQLATVDYGAGAPKTVVTGATNLTEGAIVPYADEDRKSTRLNSSHITISYAVFCLKKKK